ncbi:MAG TPA: hypothetical protein VK687_10310 [Bryobacteraceae bacterium]|nr:hypothetical protein [Bryobacteraceae bacterium]
MPGKDTSRHDERRIEQAQQRLLPGQISYIPEESQALEGLGQVNTDLVRELARREEPQKMAPIDLDSTVIESWKQQAQPTYHVGRGYQRWERLSAHCRSHVAEHVQVSFADGMTQLNSKRFVSAGPAIRFATPVRTLPSHSASFQAPRTFALTVPPVLRSGTWTPVAGCARRA